MTTKLTYRFQGRDFRLTDVHGDRAQAPGVNKEQVANVLVEIGVLLELKGENPFKTRAYANGARALEGLDEPLKKVVAENRLGEIKGIGEALQKKITELVTTGKLVYYEAQSVPAGEVVVARNSRPRTKEDQGALRQAGDRLD